MTATSQSSDAKDNSGSSFRIDSRWLITMNEDEDVLEEYSLVVERGRIAAILPWAEARERYPDLPAHDERDAIVMPGLINAHTHLAMNLLRGFADDKPLETWLEQHIWPAEARYMSEEFVRDGTELAVAESLLAGVTTINDMYFFANTTAEICESAGIRALLGLLVIDFPSAWADSVDEYFQKALELHDQLKQNPRISSAFAPHAPYSVSRPSLERIAILSDELNLPVHIHVQETSEEIRRFQNAHGVRPLQMLRDIGLLKPQLLAVHLTHLSTEDIDALAKHGVQAIHCPESNLKLASGICPLVDLLSAGVNVAIGTDGAASNNDLDLIGECRSAAFLAKAVSSQADQVPAMRALRMITRDAARALGLGDKTGSLEVGKAADCISVTPDLSMMPIYDPASTMLYSNSSAHVQNVWVDGQQLVKNRQLLTLDSNSLMNKAEHWQRRISSGTA